MIEEGDLKTSKTPGSVPGIYVKSSLTSSSSR